MFDNQLVTVWSAPNYCYRCGNSASIMQVKEDGTTDFKVYMAAEENERDSKSEAARRVSGGPGGLCSLRLLICLRSLRGYLRTLCNIVIWKAYGQLRQVWG